jgi:predicted Zn-dependent protease with MMP-like domain
MLNLTEELWNALFDKADETIQKTIADLPEPVQVRADQIICNLDKYTALENWHILGLYAAMTNGPIIVYVGQIYEDNKQNMEETMQSVRQVYLHELAHAIGNLEEYEVKARGL